MAPFRHRNRKINTCLECRRLKRRCDRMQPCSQCQKHAKECVFPVVSSTVASTSNKSGGGLVDNNDNGTVASGFAVSQGTQQSTKDACLQIGRLSITERIGGLPRADFVPMLEDILHQQPVIHKADQFSAPIATWFKRHTTLPLGQLMSTGVPVGPDVPGSSVSDAQLQVLLDQFFTAVFPICPLVTRQELDDNCGGSSYQALIMAVVYAAAMSLPSLNVQRMFERPKDSLTKNLRLAAEKALQQADIFNSFELVTFQALLIYLTPQFLSEVSRSHVIFLGAVTRHFQMAGFDVDSSQDDERQRQIKRHLWQHLLFLNIRATEAAGPEWALIDDSDSKLPLMENNELALSLVRYECYRIHRHVFSERMNISKGKTTFQAVLQAIDSLCLDVKQRYLDQLDDTAPIQKYTKVVGILLLCRAEGMVLHSRWKGWRDITTSSELQNRSIQSCISVLEAAMALESDPELASWAWYSGAYQQHHSILPLLCQLFIDPNLPTASRIMTLVDHVFGPSPGEIPQVRAARVLGAIKDNMASFLAALRGSAHQLEGAEPQMLDGSLGFMPDFTLSTTLDDIMANNSGSYADMNAPFGPTGGADLWWQWPPSINPLEGQDLG